MGKKIKESIITIGKDYNKEYTFLSKDNILNNLISVNRIYYT